MNVFMDANSIQATGVDSAAFKALRNYLKRTDSRLMIPFVVLEELCANRERAIRQVERTLHTVQKDLQRLMPGEAVLEIPPLNVAAAVELYRDQILRIVGNSVTIVSNRREDMEELIRRLVNRVPPASSKGEEARDVLIWLALLPLALSARIAFITNDKRAFFKDDGLRPELLAELCNSPDNVTLFATVDDFLSTHHKRSSFIDMDWVKDHINEWHLTGAVGDFVDQNALFFYREIEKLGRPTGYESVIRVLKYKIEKFFVSDVAPDQDELYVSATITAELQVEVEYETYQDSHRRGEPVEIINNCIYPEVSMELQLGVLKRDITSIVVGSMEQV